MKKMVFIVMILLLSINVISQKLGTYFSSQGNYSYWDSLAQVYTSPSYLEFKPALKITLSQFKLTISKSTYVIYKEIERIQENESSHIMWEAINGKNKKCRINLVMQKDFETDSEDIVLYVIYTNKIFGYLID